MLEIKNRKTQILYLEKNAITHSIERIDVPIYIHRFDIGNIEETIYIAEGKMHYWNDRMSPYTSTDPILKIIEFVHRTL